MNKQLTIFLFLLACLHISSAFGQLYLPLNAYYQNEVERQFLTDSASTLSNAHLSMKPILDKIFTEKNEFLLMVVPIALLAVSILRGVATYLQNMLTMLLVLKELIQRLQ